MAGKSYKGIYSIKIGNKYYVGKDSNIMNSNRLIGHIAFLRKGTHNNKDLQKAYSDYGGDSSITYSIHCFSRHYSELELRDLEMFWVEKLDSFNNGYNKTLGGVGMWGYTHTEEHKEKLSIANSSENNAGSKFSNEQFFEMVEMFKKGMTNEEIADEFGLHSRYVSLVRHKKRHKKLWDKVDGYISKKSNKLLETRMLNWERYVEVREMSESGATNKMVELAFGLSSGQASRLKNGKTYKDFYNRYENEK